MEIPYIVNPRKDTGLNNSKIAIWLFLASEVMLFGGLFSSYIFLRIFADYPWPERALPVLPGLVNTFILIASSVTVVYAWAALKLGNWNKFRAYMSFTIICAAVFMVFKGNEYYHKFHHHAVQTTEFTTIEGHLHAESAPDAHDHTHGGNFFVIEGNAVDFALASYYGPYLDEILRRNGEHEIKIQKNYIATRIEDFKFQEELIAKAGTVVTGDELKQILADAKTYYLSARTHNQQVRTAALRLAWERIRSNYGEKYNALVGLDQYDDAVKVAVAGLHKDLIDENMTGTLLNDGDSISITLDNPTIKLNPEWGRFKGSNVAGDESSIKLKDSTIIRGIAGDSGIEIDVDAIDFRHLVQKAEERDLDVDIEIEKSPILAIKGAGGDKLRKLWATHKEWRVLFTAHLTEKYGSDEDGEPNRVPTEVDLYRVTWKQMVAYERLDYKVTSWDDVEKNAPSLIEGFSGANHKAFPGIFPTVSVPREQIRFESSFSPKMNNYYAIYFTITGLHGLHVVGGALVLAYYLFFGRGMFRSNPEWLANRVEVAGLFWHFVDLVWIFAFPIFYLM